MHIPFAASLAVWTVMLFTGTCTDILETRTGGNNNDALSLKATPRDAIAKLKSFWALNLSCRQT